MATAIDLQISKAHRVGVDKLWAKQRASMTDLLFLRLVQTEAEDWKGGTDALATITAYAQLLLADRWKDVKPRLRKEVEKFFLGWLDAVMKPFDDEPEIPNRILSKLMNEAEARYKEVLYKEEITHPEEWTLVRSWLWGRTKNHKHPVALGTRILWPVSVAYYSGTNKPAKGGPYSLASVEMDIPDRNKRERRFRACVPNPTARPQPKRKNDRIVGAIDSDGIICICQEPFTDRIIYFEIVGFTKTGTGCFVKPVEARKGDVMAVFNNYDVEPPKKD